jgi:hypothetical protein
MELFDSEMRVSFFEDKESLTKSYIHFKSNCNDILMLLGFVLSADIIDEIAKINSLFFKEFEQALMEEKHESSNRRCLKWLIEHFVEVSGKLHQTIKNFHLEFFKTKKQGLRDEIALEAKKEMLVFVDKFLSVTCSK